MKTTAHDCDEHRRFYDALLANEPVILLNAPNLRREFERLHVRQWGLPTSVRPGRLWRTETASGVWWVHGFVPYDEGRCRVARASVLLLPDGAAVRWENGLVVLRCAGRELVYGFPRVPVNLLQGDAQMLATPHSTT